MNVPISTFRSASATVRPSVLLIAHSQYLAVYVGIARKLKAELGAEIHLYTSTRQELDFYDRTYPGQFASISVMSGLYAKCREPVTDEAAVVGEARKNEIDLGVTISELTLGDRHLGRGFALGGFGHPRSTVSEDTSYLQVLNGFNDLIAFWRREIDEKRPQLLLNADKILSVMGRKLGIPIRALAGSRFKNYHYWAVNEFLEVPESALNLDLVTESATELNRPYDSYLSYRRLNNKQKSLWATYGVILYVITRHIYWKLRRYEKGSTYYLFENIAYLWRSRKAAKEMTGRDVPTLEDVKDKRYVFFPLATEPETSLQCLSPEYFFQLSCIASISRDLPAGCLLIVKEHHTAIGRRPADFYAQIREFKNACFLNMDEPGFYVVQNAAAVVTISGTAGFEAAIAGKPTIVFGRHNLYRHLPHVFEITDEAQLKGALDRAIFGDWSASKSTGQRFLAAMQAISFDLGAFSPWKPTEIDEAAVADAYDSLMASGIETLSYAQPRA